MKIIILSVLALSISVNLVYCTEVSKEVTNESGELNDTIMSFPNFLGWFLLVTYVIMCGIFHISRYYSNLNNPKKSLFLYRSALFITVFINGLYKNFSDIFLLILFAFNISIHIYIWRKIKEE
jgi:hypothetical protein